MTMRYLHFVFFGMGILLFPVCSCSTRDAAAQILGASSTAPVFLACKAVSETEIIFRFSLPVKVISLRFSPATTINSVEAGSTVRVSIAKNSGPGEKITADLLAEDEHGNTINVLVPFRSRNNRIPAMCVNELRTEYSKPKAEYIEFKTLKAGNLGALRVFIAGNFKNPLVYEFSPVEVNAEEYVLLHLRTPEEGCRDEYGINLDESSGTDAVAGVRDVWIPGSEKLLHKTDIVYILDQDDKVLDAVVLAESPESWWNKEYFAEAADFLFRQDAWKSAEGKIAGPADAVNSSTIKTALTKSISRNEKAADTNTAADWYATAASGYSPGKPNKPQN
jgi:hypothetical protein